MGIAQIKGRDFTDRDQHKSPQVIIVSETFAKQFFPGEDPIGKRIKPGISTFEDEKPQMREIVGVVGDVKNQSLGAEPKPAFYVPHAQVPFNQMTVVLQDH